MVFPARNGRRQTRLHTFQHRTLCVRGKEPCPRGVKIRDGVVGEQVRYHVCPRRGRDQMLARYERSVYGGAGEIGACVHAKGKDRSCLCLISRVASMHSSLVSHVRFIDLHARVYHRNCTTSYNEL